MSFCSSSKYPKLQRQAPEVSKKRFLEESQAVQLNSPISEQFLLFYQFLFFKSN